ncbi:MULTISPECIES: 2Fe-2S iron-sulfur cluster-binding protein [Bacillaceae]|uniref:(2Fe-2S)-binding protein n=1 Tax=Domibacillus aminovorans TaxID=29332 RepID=A0A177LA44_9BACI|nr:MULTISPECIES: 2Fe-2S iron-sulfur cluster-binding protein [Bacillaceae]OAH57619.1 (2Fe-2S)-binding protein [Domibacillus aminovorans]OAH62354.1 (2Fe-2S)-binding protein [Domibacillus aminovorans]
MPYLTVNGYGTFEIEKGKKLVLALEDSGVNILHRCGGKARCTTCRVEILEGDYCEPTNTESHAFLEKGIIDDNLRLSCQIRVDGDINVRPIMTVENSSIGVGPRPIN